MQIIYTVPQGHCVIIERLGKFSRIQQAGLHIRLPFIEKIKSLNNWEGHAVKVGNFIELAEQKTETKPRQCQTKDNVTAIADAVVYWKIMDTEAAVYNIDRLPHAVADTALNALRANIGKYTLDELLSIRELLNESISAQLSDVSKKWGVVFTRVEIQEIQYDKDTHDAMLLQMTAERRKLALISEAEGESKAMELKAKAAAEAAIIEADGKAKALVTIANAEAEYISTLSKVADAKDVASLLLAQKMLNGLDIITQNSTAGDKIYLPSSLTAMRALVDVA
jgi:regulator of protease activity HflC (stomatin/prohibitin superfamily)